MPASRAPTFTDVPPARGLRIAAAGDPAADPYALLALALWQTEHGLAAEAHVAWQRCEAAFTRAGLEFGAATARWAREQAPGRRPGAGYLTFTVLGEFQVRGGDGVVCAWPRPLAARVVRLLLVHRGRVVCEDELFEAFWPGKDPVAARRCLTVTLSLARKLLVGAGGCVIHTEGRCHRLALDPGDRVDSDLFEAAAAAALRGEGDVALLERAAALWGGEPLPEERYAGWAATWRDGLIDRHAEVLTALTDAYDRAGRAADAVRTARRRVDLDPLDEAAQQALIVAYVRAGRRARALDQFLVCRRLLVQALGVEPSERTRDLHRRVLAGAPV